MPTETVQQPAFGQHLRFLRQASGFSQAQLAGSELSVSYVSLVESGRRAPTQRTLEIFASRLGIPVKDLSSPAAPRVARERELAIRFAELALAEGDAENAAAHLPEVHDVQYDAALSWRVLWLRARIAEARGDLEAAISLLERLREEAERNPQENRSVPVAIALSRCYRESGDLSRAVEVGEQVLRDTRRFGLEDAVLPELVSTVAIAYAERGDVARASQMLTAALEALPEGLPSRRRGALLWNAAIVAADQDRHDDALHLAERALALFADDDDERSIARLKVLRAWLLLEQPAVDARSARSSLRAALPALRRSGSDVDMAYAETELARAELALGQPEEARHHAEKSLRLLGDQPRIERARACIALARALSELGDADAARLEFAEAAAALERVGATRQASTAWRELADVEARSGRSDAAVTYYQRALAGVGIRSRPHAPSDSAAAPNGTTGSAERQKPSSPATKARIRQGSRGG